VIRDLLRRRDVRLVIGLLGLTIGIIGLVTSLRGSGDDAADAPADEAADDGAPDEGATPDGAEPAPDGVPAPTVVPPPPSIEDRYSFTALEIGGGGWVTGMEIHPSGLAVARTDVGGAFRYDAAAGRWQQMLILGNVEDPVPADYQVESIAIAPSDPNRLHLAVGDDVEERSGRILTSLDGGVTWTAAEQRFPIAGNIEWRTGGERLSVDPSDPDIVWLGTRTAGVWRSTDGGTTFTAIEGLPDGTAWPDETPSGIGFVLAAGDATYVGVAGSGVWRSSDGGGSWEQLWAATGLPYDAELDAAGRLWVTEIDGSAVRRFDPGTGEVAVLAPEGEREFATVATHRSDPDVVIVTGRDVVQGRQMWRSVDGGESWDAVGVGVSCDVATWLEEYGSGYLSVSSLEFDPIEPDRLWFPEGFGVWRADGVRSGDLAFVCDTLGIEELVANDIAVPQSGTPVTASWDRAFFAHPPGGTTTAVQGPSPRFNSAWSLTTTPAVPGRVYGIVSDHRFCCEGDGQAFWAGWSDDGGRTWEPLASVTDGTLPTHLRFGNLAVSSTDPDVMVWLPSFDRPLHRSADGGASWEQVLLPGLEDRVGEDGETRGGSHFAFFLDRHVLTADPVALDTFYLYHGDFGVFVSTDGGATWALQPGDPPPAQGNGFFNARLEAVPGREGHLLFTPGPLDESVPAMSQTRDGGRTWEIVEGTASVQAIGFGVAHTPDGPPTVYVAGVIGGVRGVFRSVDDLVSWELLTEAPGGLYNSISAITGDPEIPGRVYIGFDGNGYMQGDEIDPG
jgi:hypothetical protein